jgi:hypothetical protein
MDENQNMTETQKRDAEVEEVISILLANLPRPLQDFVLGDERDEIILSLSTKYHLHADQAGEFEVAFMNLLLGAFSPDQFVTELQTHGFDAGTIQGLVKDINEQVFVPLRQAEQERGVAPGVPASATPQPTQWVEVTPQAAAPVAPTPVLPPVAPAPVPQTPVQPPAPASVPSYAAPAPMPQPGVSTPMPGAIPLGHTMAADMAALQHPAEAAPPVPMPMPAWGAPPVPQPWNVPPPGMQYLPPQMAQPAYMPPGYWPAQPMQAYPVPMQYQYPQPQPVAPSPPPAPMPPPAPTPEPPKPMAPSPLPGVPPMPPPPLPGPADTRGQAHDRFGLDPYREYI